MCPQVNPSVRTSNRRRPAFTMVELLVVMLILTSLAAMVVGVGWILSQQQERRLTVVYQDIILGAIQTYANLTGGVPANPGDPGPGGTYGEISVQRPPDMTDTQWNIYARSAILYMDLIKERECVNQLAKLPQGAVLMGVLGQPAAFVDAYGHYMDYRDNRACGGPLLISGGPDGYIGDEYGAQYAADDIRSDERTPE